jgi:hypothetical protein
MRTAPKSKNSKSSIKKDLTENKPEAGVPDPDQTQKIAVAASSTLKEVTSQEKHHLVSEAAYFRAERRNFIPGYELEDWLVAESEIEKKLSNSSPKSRSRKA